MYNYFLFLVYSATGIDILVSGSGNVTLVGIYAMVGLMVVYDIAKFILQILIYLKPMNSATVSPMNC